MYSLVPFRSVHIPTRCIVAQCCVCRIEEQVWSLLLTVIWRNVHQSVRVHNHFNINISSVLNKSFTVNKSFYVNISFHVNKSFTVNKSFNVKQIKNAIVYSLQSSVFVILFYITMFWSNDTCAGIYIVNILLMDLKNLFFLPWYPWKKVVFTIS